MKRILLALAAVSLLGGCGSLGIGGKGKKNVTPTVGERISVLSQERVLEVDPALAGIAVTLPPAQANAEWTQSGGNAAKSMGHLAFGTAPGMAWRVSIGEGNSNQAQLASSPVLGEGRIFTIDTRAVVRAISPENGGTVWQTQVRGANAPEGALFGGGVAYDNGRIYATNGAGDAAAIDAKTGALVWRVRPGGPLRGAPTVANDNVYVVTQDNQLFALNPANGATRWTGSGAVEIAGVLGAASPAAAQGTVVAGFSTGELNAYRYENGQNLWQDALARTSISTSVTQLSDIDADPVIDSGRVYAVGQGGRMVAIELITGQRIWEINVAGISTPWVAGDWVFVVTDEAQAARLVADHRRHSLDDPAHPLSRRQGQEGADRLGRPDPRRRPARARQFGAGRSSTSRPPTAASRRPRTRGCRCRSSRSSPTARSTSSTTTAN